MKKLSLYVAALFMVAMMGGCKKDSNYPGGTLSPYIAIFDVRELYKGEDVTLTKENMYGAENITGLVTSNHAGGNIPAGLLVLQDSRRLSRLRGIAIQIGAAAASYVPGDSVIIAVEGATLKKVDGLLQLTGIDAGKITKVASGRPLQPVFLKTTDVLANRLGLESTLIAVASAFFDPNLPPGSTYVGDKLINDGFGDLTLHTEASATFANKTLPFLSTFTGILFNSADGVPKLWPRVEGDINILSATAPKIASIVIAGFLTDPAGTDGNYEYIQLMATRNIDFSLTPFSVVTNNNAGASAAPASGWATGAARTYKFNLTSGIVNAGQYFYVGANKNIWGANSTDISSAKWFGKMYVTVDGDDFGTKTTNLLANSGNGAGIAVFDKIAVDANTVPIDVIFFGGAGPLYTAGPPERGYRITDTDLYAEKNPANSTEQPYYGMGSNTSRLAFPTVVSGVGGSFAKLGGKYKKSTGRWTTARALNNTVLTAASQLTDIETGGTVIE